MSRIQETVKKKEKILKIFWFFLVLFFLQKLFYGLLILL